MRPSATLLAATGVTNAARVSYGSKHDEWGGLIGALRNGGAERHPSERVTVTIVLYNVVVGGVPSEEDVVAAIDDLERLYAACRASPRVKTTMFNAELLPGGGLLPAWTTPPSLFTMPKPTPLPNPPDVYDAGTFQRPQASILPCGTVPFAPFADVPSWFVLQHSQLPRTMAAFTHVHDSALELLAPPTSSRSQLASAFGQFRLANELHVQLDGSPSATVMYNLACCLSRLAALDKPTGEAPLPGSALALSKDACLNAAVGWLRAAAAAGYTDPNHMKMDTDLQAVRELRAPFFATAVKMAEVTAGGM